MCVHSVFTHPCRKQHTAAATMQTKCANQNPIHGHDIKNKITTSHVLDANDRLNSRVPFALLFFYLLLKANESLSIFFLFVSVKQQTTATTTKTDDDGDGSSGGASKTCNLVLFSFIQCSKRAIPK